MKKIILSSILIVLFFSACEKNITIDVPVKDPSLVINAWLEKDEPISLTIGKSRHILLPANNFNYQEDYMVDNAMPVIYENGVVIDTLIFDSAIYRYTTRHDKRIRNGYTYSVKATAPGYPDASAETIVPSQSVITEVTRQRNVRSNSYGEQVDDIVLKLDDPAGENNFYLIQIFGPSYGNAQGYSISCVSTTDKDIETTGYEDDPTESDNCYDGSRLLMKDVNFNGRQKQVKFSIVSDQLPEHNYNGRIYRPYIKVFRITEDHFKYVKSLALYENLDGNPFSEPVNVYSNAKKGYGIFSAYTMAVDTLR